MMHYATKHLNLVFLIFFHFFCTHSLHASHDLDEVDTIQKFNITFDHVRNGGLTFKNLKKILNNSEDDSFDIEEAHGVRFNRSMNNIEIIHADKFAKAFRDLHICLLSSLDVDSRELKSCRTLTVPKPSEIDALQQLKIGGVSIFKKKCQKAIFKAFPDRDFINMIQTTTDAIHHYALKRLSPALIASIDRFLADAKEDHPVDQEDQSEDAAVGLNASTPPAEDQQQSMADHEEELLADLFEVSKHTLNGVGPHAHTEPEDAADEVAVDDSEALEALKEEIEEHQSEIIRKNKLINQQKLRIQENEVFETILSLLLTHHNIDPEALTEAISNKEPQTIQDLLAPVLSEESLRSLDEELQDKWPDEDEDEEEEDSDEGREEGDEENDQ